MKQRLEKFSLNDFNKSNILFALGKAYEDIKDYEKSFAFLDEANNLLKKITKYDFSNDENLFKNLIEKFSNFEFKEINKKFNDKVYIFIVGLPRSGTSLIEQILSSHSSVYGAGELQYLPDAIKTEFFSKIKQSRIRLLKRKYLNSLIKM